MFPSKATLARWFRRLGRLVPAGTGGTLPLQLYLRCMYNKEGVDG